MRDARARPTVTCMTRRLALVVLPLVLLVAPLVACTESARIPPAEPPSAIEPLFASDAEALAAATEAYEQYLAVSNAASATPSEVPTTLKTLVSDDYFAELQDSLESLADKGLRTQGQSQVAGVALQQYVEFHSTALIVLYVCLDVSQVEVLDAQGQLVTPADRDSLVDLEVDVVALKQGADAILITGSEVWSEGSVCESP